MSDLLGIGAAGVAAYRTALAVVGDNVANADTPGYVRRKIEIRATGAGAAQSASDLTIVTGNGARVASVGRADDALKTEAARNAGSDLSRIATRGEWLTRLQSALGTGDASLDKQLGGFFDAAQDLASSPSSAAARTIFLDGADQAAASFRVTAGALDDVARDVTAASVDAVANVNRLTGALAAINASIRITSGSADTANGLLDQRDQTLAELATYVRVSTTDTGGGTIDVRLGDGANAPLLVRGGTATSVGVRDRPGGAELVLDPSHNPVGVRLPASGSLAGLVEAGRRVASTIATVDALATRFAAAANGQHRAGVDADGVDGQDLFTTRTLGVVPGRANGGDATVDVVVTDATAIGAGGYVARFDGSAWWFARSDGSASVSGVGALTLDGVTLTAGGMAHAGDSFVLAPRDGAAGIALRPLAAREVAAAGRWLSDADGSNIGTGRISVTIDDAASALPPLPAYGVTVTSATTADIVDPANGTVVAAVAFDGTSVRGAGFSFRLDGTPVAGDSFRIVRNADASGDNANVRALAALREAGGVGNTIEDNLDATIGGIASTLSETKALTATAQAVRDDAVRAADAVGGVDLDAEAAELVRLQAAYKANAQVIAAARELFDTLLHAVS